MRVVAVTPSGGRPECLGLLARWLCRMDPPPDAWLVAHDDDDDVPSSARSVPAGPPARNTFKRNLRAGLEAARWETRSNDLVLFLEDDDWYAADYVKTMSFLAERWHASLVGLTPTLYYHITQALVCPMGRAKHRASLAVTGIRGASIDTMLECIDRCGADWIDIALWKSWPQFMAGERGTLAAHGSVTGTIRPYWLHVGLKGMPGRPGIGVGHRPSGDGWMPDPDRGILAHAMGQHDAEIVLAAVEGKR